MARARQLDERGLTIAQLLRNTPSYVRNTSAYVSIRTLKQRRDGIVQGKTATLILGSRPHIHLQEIELLNGRNLALGRVRVQCDCEFYLYTCEVALHRHGAANIVYSNAEFPYVTNPRGIPLVCKHLYLELSRLKGR